MTYFYILVAGAVSIIGQVVLFRELINVFSGSEIVLIFGFGLLLFSSSIGVLSSRGLSLKRAKILFVIFAFSFASLFLFCSSLRPFFGMTRGLILPLEKQFASIFFILFPFGFICGKLFGEFSLLALREGALPSKTYAIDTVGAVLGGIITFLLIHFGTSQSVSVLFVVLLSLFAMFSGKKTALNIIAFGILLLFAIFFVPVLNEIHFSILKLEDKSFKEIKETPYGRISISSDEGQAAVFFNNSLCFESESVSAENLVHLPLSCVENLKSVLIVGGTSEGVLREVLKHNPERVDIVELDKEMINLPKKYIQDDRFEGFSESRVKLFITDGRMFLDREMFYDAVIVSSMDQNSISGNRFFTEEFIKKVASRINKGGVFAVRVKSAENFQSQILMEKNGATLKPFFETFETALLIPYSDILAVGVKGKFSIDEAVQRFKERQINTNLVSPKYLNYLLTNERRKRIEEIIKNGNWQKNSDLKPSAYFLSLLLEVSRDFPRLSSKPLLEKKIKRSVVFLLIFCFVLVLILRMFSKIKESDFLVFVAGFWGIASEISILVYYQVKKGILYQDVGILTSLFMAGLALGAWLFPKDLSKKLRLTYILSIAVLSFLAVFSLSLNIPAVLIFLAILFCGFISGSFFKIAESASKEKGDNLLKRLYFIDLLGGSFGAVFSTLFLIPVFGLTSSFILMALLTIFCL